MVDLTNEIDDFLKWLSANSIPTFMEYVKTHEKDGMLLVDIFQTLGLAMRKAAEIDNKNHFSTSKEKYLKYFKEVCQEISEKEYQSLLKVWQHKESDNEVAQISAALDLFKSPAYRRWFPKVIKLVFKNGKEVSLVSQPEYASKGEEFITIEELESRSRPNDEVTIT